MLHHQGFRLFPNQPTTDCKLVIVKEKPEREITPLTIISWKRILPNNTKIPIFYNREGYYQCTVLDNHCRIQATVSYKVQEKVVNACIVSGVITLNQQLKQRSLYVMQPMSCRVHIDQFSILVRIYVEDHKVIFLSELGKFQTAVTENLVQVQPFQCFAKLNFVHFKHDFVNFYCIALKFTPKSKFKSNYCFLYFNTKIEQDLFLVGITECYKEVSNSNTNIKIVSSNQIISTNSSKICKKFDNVEKQKDKDKQKEKNKDKQLKNDGSASSLTSNSKSRNKYREKGEKVKISERINLKKSSTKLSGNNPKQQKYENNNHTERECLNIFEEDDQLDIGKSLQPSSNIMKQDLSMDLRRSFEQCEKKNNIKDEGEEKLSNQSFCHKNGKDGKASLEQENNRLKDQNMKLKKQLESISQTTKQAIALRKKYNKAMQENEALDKQRKQILADKIKFQNAFIKEKKEKQDLIRELEALRMMHGVRVGRP